MGGIGAHDLPDSDIPPLGGVSPCSEGNRRGLVQRGYLPMTAPLAAHPPRAAYRRGHHATPKINRLISLNTPKRITNKAAANPKRIATNRPSERIGSTNRQIDGQKKRRKIVARERKTVSPL